jgi:ribonuclease HII
MAQVRTATQRTTPTLDLEREAWLNGARWVAGLDEVGRGALAGPVVVSAVVLRPADEDRLMAILAGVRDSKQLAPRARCELLGAILDVAATVTVAAASPVMVDTLGIVGATNLAARRALGHLPFGPDLLLVDGWPLPWYRGPQRAIIRGDGQVLSIAAASIVAKVHRDALMVDLGTTCPDYGFDRHKGYGTAAHRRVIATRGPTIHHRLTWALLRPGTPGVAEGYRSLVPNETLAATPDQDFARRLATGRR